LSLREIDVVALLHRAHGSIAGVLVLEASQHVVQQALTHSTLCYAHFLQAEYIEDLGKNHRSTREYRPAILRDSGEPQLAYVASIRQVLERTLQSRRCDHQALWLQLAYGFTNGPDGPRASGAMLPTASSKRRLYRLELQTGSHPCALDAL